MRDGQGEASGMLVSFFRRFIRMKPTYEMKKALKNQGFNHFSGGDGVIHTAARLLTFRRPILSNAYADAYTLTLFRSPSSSWK